MRPAQDFRRISADSFAPSPIGWCNIQVGRENQINANGGLLSPSRIDGQRPYTGSSGIACGRAVAVAQTVDDKNLVTTRHRSS